MNTLKHFGNLRLLETKAHFKSISQAICASLEMVEAADKAMTFQILSRDIIITKDQKVGEYKVARPIVGYLGSSHLYKTRDEHSAEYQSILWDGENFDACALEFEAFGVIDSRIRIEFESNRLKTYFERAQVN